MSQPRQSAREIFLHAVEITDAAERERYLVEACGDDVALRKHVAALLLVHDQPDSVLDQERIAAHVLIDPAALAPTVEQPTERPGTQIGPYKLLQEIGEGGMGTVYMAEQLQPVRRKVALKIIKPGMDTRQVIARFEAERQALSLMDHPNIARVLDAGTTGSGRPYFVMELVKGQPISQYCNEKRLTPRQRLEILLPVCHAIQHAHQKGIIHRDIKPSNILVAEYDQQPVPKVIDFGVAKATSGALTEKTMFTGLGQIIGTLEYMSPEQAKVNQLDVDTRTDVYSLGVLLYELLTGTTPFDRKRLRSAAWDEMLRIIREEEPPRPSTRLSDSQDSLPSISAQRQTEPARLTRLMRGELDWIVMKAMEKDRNRRYETVSALAADLQHYLSDEPVVACPPNVAYRLQKFVRRNRVSVLATVLSLLGLVAVTTASVVAAITYQRMADQNATLAKDLKAALGDVETNLKQVKEKEQLAQTNLGLATTEQERAEENLDLALKAMDAVYLVAIGRDKLLRAQAETLEGGAQNRIPALTEQERQLVQRGLQFYEQFAKRNATTPRASAQTAQAYYRVGLMHVANRDRANARNAMQEAIRRFIPLTEQFPENFLYHAQLADAYVGLATNSEWRPKESDTFQKAERAFTRSLALWPDNAIVLLKRAHVYSYLHQGALALADQEQAAKLDPNNVQCQSALAEAYFRNEDVSLRDNAKALRHAERAVELAPENASCHIELGDIHLERFNDPETAIVQANIAMQLAPRTNGYLYLRGKCHRMRGDYLAALQDFTEAIRRDDTNTWLFMDRCLVLAALGRLEEAMADATRSVELDPQNSHAFKERAVVYIRQRQYQKALDDLAKHHALTPQYPYAWKWNAYAEFHLGRYDDAIRSIRVEREKLPRDLSALIWIPVHLIVRCPDERFKSEFLKVVDEAVPQDPEDFVALATIAAHFGNWSKAHKLIEEFITMGRCDPVWHYQAALLCLMDDNFEKYQAVCREMLTRFAGSPGARQRYFVTWTIALVSGAIDDLEPVLSMARRDIDSSKSHPDAIRSLGAILYRAGKYEEAARQLAPLVADVEKSGLEAKSSSVYPMLFMAMTQHQLGKRDEALNMLDRAVKLARSELDDESHPPTWNRKLTLELLQKEAERVIADSNAPAESLKPNASEPQEEPRR